MTAPQDPYPQTDGPGSQGDHPGAPGDAYSNAPGGYPAAPGESFPAAGPPPRPGAQIFSIIAIICGVLSILILPIIFGPIGIILAVVGQRRNERLWKIALGVAVGGMVLGFVLGAIVNSNT